MTYVIPRVRISLLSGSVIEAIDDTLPDDDELAREEISRRTDGPPQWVWFGDARVFTSRIAAIELA